MPERTDTDLKDLSARLAQWLEANSGKQIDWLSQLVRFDSTRGKEAACQRWLSGEFAARGWTVDCFTIDEVGIEGVSGAGAVVDADYTNALQVVADLGARAEGRSLILQGHIDVVPPGAPELWDRDPFAPHIEDGAIHGRGTADMKVGVAEIVFALDALRGLGFLPAGQVLVETVSEEECTGNGALATLKRQARSRRPRVLLTICRR
jgi:acetylornithine deacetylase